MHDSSNGPPRPAGLGGALEAQPDLILIGLNEPREISRWTEAAQEALGWSCEEIIGRLVEVLFPEAGRDELWHRIGRPGDPGPPARGEWRADLLARDGRSVPCAVHFLADSNGPTLLVRLRENTGAVEARLRGSDSLLSVLAAATLVFDPGGKIREISASWPLPESASGADWVGREAADLFGGDRREVLAALREAARLGRWVGHLPIGGRPTSLVLRAVHDPAGNLEAIVGACVPGDMEGLEALLWFAPVPMILLDGDLRILGASAKASALCGVEGSQDLVGLDARSLNIFQVRPIQEALEGMLEDRHLELPNVRIAAGHSRQVDAAIHGCPMLDAMGRRSGYLVAVLPRSSDAEDRQLLRAQRMESIGSFTSGLAHDFGNFVAVILGKTSMLRVKLPEDPHVTRDLDDIETAAKRAQHLSQELMRFARGGRSGVSRLDLNSLIDSVGSLIQTSVGRRITLDVRLEDGLPPVDGDAVELQQLVLNLCLNGRDAMPNGGRLTIETRALTEEQRVRLGAGGDPLNGLCIVVRDTGMGMPPEVLERIFEPFFTTKNETNKGGAGLGLAMVYGIVRRHGGAIDVKSRPSVGTAFEILLPAATTKVEEQARGVTLVVDDEPAFGEMIRLILEEDGHHVKLASNGIEALRTIQEEHANLMLIILDLKMPGLDGLGVLDELREIAPELPVLVTTGYAGAEEQQEALRRGARKVLEKPYRVAELRAALEAVLAAPAAGSPHAQGPGDVAVPPNRPTPRQPSGEFFVSGGGAPR